MTNQNTDHKGKTLYFSIFNNTFFLLLVKGAPHFHVTLASPIM